MYNPVKDGIEKTVRSVQYTEVRPPRDLSNVVHCFWELKTDKVLAGDFHLHALPDACVNILFNVLRPEITAITALQTTYEVLTLGKSFHYVGVQLFPGVWQGNREEIFDRFVDEPYAGSLPLVEASIKLVGNDFAAKQQVLADLVRRLIDEKVVVANAVTATILTHIDDIATVADMAAVIGMSTRHLQRVLKQTTGFSPHDLLKIIRLQHSFGRGYQAMYTDQSHFIHSFRKITGFTPAEYAKRFDV